MGMFLCFWNWFSFIVCISWLIGVFIIFVLIIIMYVVSFFEI